MIIVLYQSSSNLLPFLLRSLPLSFLGFKLWSSEIHFIFAMRSPFNDHQPTTDVDRPDFYFTSKIHFFKRIKLFLFASMIALNFLFYYSI